MPQALLDDIRNTEGEIEAQRSVINAKLRERGLLERSLITPQCGLGGLDEANAERVLDLLNGTVEAIRQRYRLGGLA